MMDDHHAGFTDSHDHDHAHDGGRTNLYESREPRGDHPWPAVITRLVIHRQSGCFMIKRLAPDELLKSLPVMEVNLRGAGTVAVFSLPFREGMLLTPQFHTSVCNLFLVPGSNANAIQPLKTC
jgi:hypothetical protein